MYQKTFKLGQNKGKPRLWLEGSWLASEGFHAKLTQFTCELTATAITLRADANGNRRVSGKGERPIIDITGDQLNAFAFKPLSLVADKGTITITLICLTRS